MDNAAVWRHLEAVRRTAPLVQNITNYVAMDVAANVLLALGASPAMVHAKEEAADFARIASSLVVNIGTLSPDWADGMRAAVRAATEAGKPWVLDPVGVGATPYRTALAAELLALKPAVVRGNASEVLSLAGAAGAKPRGVDSGNTTDEALDSAKALALTTGGAVAVTGAVDRVTDGRRVLDVTNGHPLMTRVTALGCALSGVVGAFLAVEDDAAEAAAAALAVFGLAGERAAAESDGPGSLRWRLLDRLHTLDEAAVLEGCRVR